MNRQDAYTEIAKVEGAALQLAAATTEETRLADERSLVKDAGIRRLMEAGVATSVTGAEKVIEKDAEFFEHRAQERAAVATRIVAEGKLASATLRARLAVEHWALDPRDLDERDETEAPSLEDYKREAMQNEHVIERIDKMLDDAGVIQRADGDGMPGAGSFLGIEKRVEIVLASLSSLRTEVKQYGVDWFEGEVKHGHVDVPLEFDDGVKVRVERIAADARI